MGASLPAPRLSRRFLPGLPSLAAAGTSSRSRSYKQQKIVTFPQQTIFDVVAAVEQYSEFLPWCLSSEVHSRAQGDDGVETLSTEVGVGFRLLQSSFKSQVTLTPLMRISAISEPNHYLEALSFTWNFTPCGDRACRMDLELDFTLVNADHVIMWDVAKDKIISEYLLCFQ